MGLMLSECFSKLHECRSKRNKKHRLQTLSNISFFLHKRTFFFFFFSSFFQFFICIFGCIFFFFLINLLSYFFLVTSQPDQIKSFLAFSLKSKGKSLLQNVENTEQKKKKTCQKNQKLPLKLVFSFTQPVGFTKLPTMNIN